MIDLPSNPRYERKFVVDGIALPEVLAVVRRHPAAFREVYPGRWVNNIYLDSPDWSNYHDHVNGVSHRTKTRLRWYGTWSESGVSPTLERKLKNGLLSGKLSFSLPRFPTGRIVSRFALETVFDQANLPEIMRLALRHLLPALFNRYHRHYFESADHRFRLTVDSNLHFAAAHQADGRCASFCDRASIIVVELKFGLSEADDAARITNSIPFRLARCSKYILGVNALAA